jgi:hypothetical protein
MGTTSTQTKSNDGDDKLLTIKLLETPAGKEVLEAFVRELFSTTDIGVSIDKAKEAAQKNGTLVPFEITLVADFLIRIVGPPLIKGLLESPRR